MPRPSARTAMLDAALRVVVTQGFAALTLDSAAAEAGVTKPGLIYHFPTKHALITGLHEHLTARTEHALRQSLGADPAEATQRERTIAYIRAFASPSTRADLLLLVAAHGDPQWLAPWARLRTQWFPEEDPESPEEVDLDLLLARAAADGLWSYEAFVPNTTSAARYEQAIQRILDQIDPDPVTSHNAMPSE